ncbi:probable methyltransferase TCM_000331 [Rutidosis leptorrhynchoides]|uniref:probable methyltransferase TCM_000331 n=1 Tax=Rutidosis leptorrhynchoides TaxID=125765 RepID=UPI003A992090
MKGGDGANSYASNSIFQETAIMKTKPILEETIRSMFINTSPMPICFRMADLGCSSGPNALLVISHIMDTIYQICEEENVTHDRTPELQVFLNDLIGNDFNSLFNFIPNFYKKIENAKGEWSSRCFISAVPGSFYGRLFPSKSLHFFYSAFSTHWLSKVPDCYLNNLMNKGNLYMARTSPRHVFEAYLKQFETDFFNLLRSRSTEIVCGGRMMFMMIGRNTLDPRTSDCCYPYELLTKCLFELIPEGLVQEADIDSFDLPYYTPHKEEVKKIVEMEGSFSIDKLETIEINLDPRDDVSNKDFVFDELEVGKNVSNCIRAVTEAMFVSHFGDAIIEDLFARYAKLNNKKRKFEGIPRCNGQVKRLKTTMVC